MKTLGLIGGMSWESSSLYYKIINKKVQEILGGVHSCECLMYSVDFAEISTLQHRHEWELLGEKLKNVAKQLELAGAEAIVLCTNTMHKLSDKIEQCINVPFLHIVDATAQEIKSQSIQDVGLIATKFSMEEDFLRKRYQDKYHINTIIPEAEERTDIHEIINNELVKGIIKESSKNRYIEIINNLIDRARKVSYQGVQKLNY